MKLFVASLAVLMLTLPILAPAQEAPPDEAKVVLVAPTQARVGELVRFDASNSTAESFKWLLVPQDCLDFEVYAEGRKAVFSARKEGEYVFILAVAKGGKVDVIRHIVKIMGPPQTPTTNSLTEWIPFWNWSEGLPKQECDLVANVFEGVAEQYKLTEATSWLQTTAEANRKALGARIEAWKPMLIKIGAALQKKAEAGLLATPEDYKKAWLEVAQGLKNC